MGPPLGSSTWQRVQDLLASDGSRIAGFFCGIKYICKVYEIGELPTTDAEPGYPYIAMQLISGKPLHRAFAEMSLFEKVRVMKQVAEALHVAHRQGLVHRDIKPRTVPTEAG